MQSADQKSNHDERHGKGWRSAWAVFFRSRDGSAAIEFAILALPYFLIVFAILETFLAFTAERLVSNATDILGRKIRTGEITAGQGRSTDISQPQFRTALCDEISIIIRCSSTEASKPNKLYVDLQTYSDFANIPISIPTKSSGEYVDLDTSKFRYAPGGAGKINMLRVYYRWEITTDLLRPYLSDLRPAGGGMPREYLIVATSTFQNEAYP